MFGVQVLGAVGFLDSGFRVEVSGNGVRGLLFKIQDSSFWVQDLGLGLRGSGFGFRNSGLEFKV